MPDPSISLPQIAEGEDKSSPFKNCIRNNYRHIKKWAKRTITDCFRIYDREISNVPLAIDFYAGKFCIHYYSPARSVEDPPQELIELAEKVLQELFQTQPDQIFWRTRAKHKETRQYEKANNFNAFFNVLEYGVKLKINLTDYLDTGLFLDHRETRNLVASYAKNKRVLNLFAYTASFSVHAAIQGASFTKSVDMSNTYCGWGRENFILNKLSPKTNEIIRADCLKFLDEEKASYDLIILDPPTMSRSKKMDSLFDLQNDYPSLILKSLSLLTKGGLLFFSTNSRKLKFDPSIFPSCKIEEISHKTLPIDFKDPKIHRCWKFQLN